MRANLVVSLILVVAGAGEPGQALPQPAGSSSLQIPGSIRTEHEAIHEALVAATKAPGAAGAAAQHLAEVLHPHFVREEEIALPPLGLLAPLAANRPIAGEAAALAMTDTLKRELPKMMEDHKAIRAAVVQLRQAAEAAHATALVHLADQLAGHAQMEEEVLYPAAVLAGEILRARSPRPGRPDF